MNRLEVVQIVNKAHIVMDLLFNTADSRLFNLFNRARCHGYLVHPILVICVTTILDETA